MQGEKCAIGAGDVGTENRSAAVLTSDAFARSAFGPSEFFLTNACKSLLPGAASGLIGLDEGIQKLRKVHFAPGLGLGLGLSVVRLLCHFEGQARVLQGGAQGWEAAQSTGKAAQLGAACNDTFAEFDHTRPEVDGIAALLELG